MTTPREKLEKEVITSRSRQILFDWEEYNLKGIPHRSMTELLQGLQPFIEFLIGHRSREGGEAEAKTEVVAPDLASAMAEVDNLEVWDILKMGDELLDYIMKLATSGSDIPPEKLEDADWFAVWQIAWAVFRLNYGTELAGFFVEVGDHFVPKSKKAVPIPPPPSS